MRGPFTSPRSMRSRSASVLSRSDAMSKAVVKPWRVSSCVSACDKAAAGALRACSNARPMKCTWLFWNPATITPPSHPGARAGTRAAAGSSPPTTPTIRSARSRTTPSSIGAASGAAWTRTPRSARSAGSTTLPAGGAAHADARPAATIAAVARRSAVMGMDPEGVGGGVGAV